MWVRFVVIKVLGGEEKFDIENCPVFLLQIEWILDFEVRWEGRRNSENFAKLSDFFSHDDKTWDFGDFGRQTLTNFQKVFMNNRSDKSDE